MLFDHIPDQVIAQMKPRVLLQQPGFWIYRQKRLVGLFIINSIIILALWPYIFPEGAGDSIASLNLLCWIIIIIMFLGAGWIAFATSKVEVEEAFAREIKKHTDIEYLKLKNLDRNEVLLTEVRDLLPRNNSPLLSMPRLAEHVIKNAEDRKFDSSMIIMQPYREEALNDVFKINGLQKASLQLGIVGTFLGLIAAFIEMGTSGSDIMEALPQIVEALKYSFSSSIAGLVAALSISMGILLILKRQQEAYYRSMEESTDSLIRLCRNSRNKDAFLNSFDQMKETVDQVYNGVENQTAKLQVQTQTISDGIRRLTNTKTEFEGFLNKITEVEGEFIGEMRHIYDKLSPEVTSRELRRSLNDAVKGISTSLDENLITAIKKYHTLNENLEKLGDNLGQMESRLEKQVVDYEVHSKEIRNLQKELHDFVLNFTGKQDDFVNKITGNHVAAKLLESVETVGKQVSVKQSKDLEKVTKNMEKLTSELKSYNKLVKQDLEEQTPFLAMRSMMTGLIIFINSSVKYIFQLLKRLFKS